MSTLGAILTIPEAAKRAGWSRWRMRRYLVAMNERYGGALLVNVSRGARKPIWTVSVAALRVLHPQWFQDPESLQREIDALREELTEGERSLRARVGRLERNVGAHALRLANSEKQASGRSPLSRPASSR